MTTGSDNIEIIYKKQSFCGSVFPVLLSMFLIYPLFLAGFKWEHKIISRSGHIFNQTSNIEVVDLSNV